MANRWLICIAFLYLRPVFIPSSFLISGSPLDVRWCGDGWYTFRDKCYKVFGYTEVKDRVAGEVARENCGKLGGQLASIHSKEENDFIASKGIGHRLILIGLNYNVSEKNYEWEDGSPYDFKNWDSGEPNGQTANEMCTELKKDSNSKIDGRWNDIFCGNKISYVCQKKKKKPVFEKCSDSKESGYKFRDSCYTLVNTEMSWKEAEYHCRASYKGHLVKILDLSHNSYLNYILSTSTDPLWIGIQTKNRFQQDWSSNWPVFFDNLPKDFKKDIKPDRCILRWNSTVWTDAPCNEKHKFICEESTVKPPVLTRPLQPARCPESHRNLWDFGGEYCYYFDIESSDTWYVAEHTCLKMGGHLASIHSPELEKYFWYFIENQVGLIHIGLSNLLTNRKAYSWSDGNKLHYENWDVGQPDGENEDCVNIDPITSKWHDYWCDRKGGFICQVKKEPLKVSIYENCTCHDNRTFDSNWNRCSYVCQVISALRGDVIFGPMDSKEKAYSLPNKHQATLRPSLHRTSYAVVAAKAHTGIFTKKVKDILKMRN